MNVKIICWNVNGIRAVWKKNFLDFMKEENADLFCIQESKIQESQLSDEIKSPLGYLSEWTCAERKGYSGVAIYYKKSPKVIQYELGNGKGKHDGEGRMLLFQYENFTLVNLYIPNGGQGDHRIEFKLNYYDELFDFLEELRSKGHNLVICGDFNTAHKPIDLARPKANENTTGFLPVERAWLDKFTQSGYIDCWRHFNPKKSDMYSWWSYRSAARKRNVGWRIDYFFVNKEFLDKVKSVEMLTDVMGSDHCPLRLVLDENVQI